MQTSYSGSEPWRQFRVYSAADFGVAVGEFRTAAGITQGELAELAGVQRSYLSALENGKVTEQLERVVDLLRRLDVQIILSRKGSHP